MSQPASFPELLAEVADAVRLAAVCDRCQGTGRDEADFGCSACGGSLTASGSGLNPRYAAPRNVLLEECGPDHDIVFDQNGCCRCNGTGSIPRRVWEELRAQGIKGALAGAIYNATIYEPEMARMAAALGQDDPDIAALEVVKEALNV